MSPKAGPAGSGSHPAARRDEARLDKVRAPGGLLRIKDAAEGRIQADQQPTSPDLQSSEQLQPSLDDSRLNHQATDVSNLQPWSTAQNRTHLLHFGAEIASVRIAVRPLRSQIRDRPGLGGAPSVDSSPSPAPDVPSVSPRRDRLGSLGSPSQVRAPSRQRSREPARPPRGRGRVFAQQWAGGRELRRHAFLGAGFMCCPRRRPFQRDHFPTPSPRAFNARRRPGRVRGTRPLHHPPGDPVSPNAR